MNQIALEDRSTAIYRAPNGRSTVTGTSYMRIGVKLKREPPTWAAFLSYLLMALRHQANLARWPKPATLLPFACTEDVRAHSLRLLQAAHSSQHFRGIDPTAS